MCLCARAYLWCVCTETTWWYERKLYHRFIGDKLALMHSGFLLCLLSSISLLLCLLSLLSPSFCVCSLLFPSVFTLFYLFPCVVALFYLSPCVVALFNLSFSMLTGRPTRNMFYLKCCATNYYPQLYILKFILPPRLHERALSIYSPIHYSFSINPQLNSWKVIHLSPPPPEERHLLSHFYLWKKGKILRYIYIYWRINLGNPYQIEELLIPLTYYLCLVNYPGLLPPPQKKK